MIQIHVATAFMCYLGFMLTALLFIWGGSWWRRRKRIVLPPRVELHRCEFCHHMYVEDSLKAITNCPECGSYNKHRG